ncbi:hypothetical protein MKX08_010709, partial [Trichoderma sp. CBMAI-0020]
KDGRGDGTTSNIKTSDAVPTKNSQADRAKAKSMTGYSEQKRLLEEKLAEIPYTKLPPGLWPVRVIDDSPSFDYLVGKETTPTGDKSRTLRSLYHYLRPRDSIEKIMERNERRYLEIANKPAIDFKNVTPWETSTGTSRQSKAYLDEGDNSISLTTFIDLTNADGTTPTSSQVYGTSTVATSAAAHQGQTIADKSKREARRSRGKNDDACATKSTTDRVASVAQD